jgi:hypothetical protein
MLKRYIAIDASGEEEQKKTDTDQLVIAAVITDDVDSKELLEEVINSFRRRLGWVDLHEFKFSKTNKNILVELLKTIRSCDYCAYVVVLDKTKIDTKSVVKGKVPIYNQVMKELLIKVSANHQLVTIDGKTGRRYDKQVRVYLRQILKENGIVDSRIRFVDSREDSLVQLADIIAGAVARTYKNKPDARMYAELLQDKIVSIDEITLQT